eukprot:GFUD01004475.1.p1 GENE.GFUD01004475.1~~GFUD01004475.1.p1  ORF type:complete len:1342 (+),score=251.43 GFUD01004475.1:273-4298(+)
MASSASGQESDSEVSSDSDIEDLDDAYAEQHRPIAEQNGNDLVQTSKNGIATNQEVTANPNANVQEITDRIVTEALDPSAGETKVDISNPTGPVTIGPTIIIHQRGKPDADNIPPIVGDIIINQKIKQVTEDIRFYYQTNLIVLSPLPWVQLRPFDDDYFAELTIKQISNVGRDIKARKEFNFKEIFKDSESNHFRTCILVEGSPGYGKTTLARNIAVDWGRKADYVDKFKLVVFIYCRDLKGRTLEKYVAETFPMVENADKRVNLKDWFKVKQTILFILDGLDECSPADAQTINGLLNGNVYPGASILATTRPLGEDTMINHSQFSKNVAIKGFNRDQIERLIDHYFKDREGMGDLLKQKLFGGNQAYQQLVTCPLLCQLFCLLFDKDEQIPEKVTDVYYRLIQCLIRRERMTDGKLIPDENLPPRYEQALSNFGKVCIEALVKDKFYFTEDEILKVLPDMKHGHENVIMGFLVKSNVSISRSFFNNKDCYQPLHKTFLEFVAAFYLKGLVNSNEMERLKDELRCLQDIESSSLEQVLLYTVEMLANNAYHILNEIGDIIDLKSTGNLRLLNAAGCCDNNIKALTSVMDLQNVVVKSSLLEIDAWRNICVKSDVIKQLKFQWDPKCDSLREDKIVEFFNELKEKNKSIETIQLHMFHGEIKQRSDPNYEVQNEYFQKEVEQFGANIIKCMTKENLKSFEVDLQIIQLSEESNAEFVESVVEKIVKVFHVMSDRLSLVELKLNIDLGTSDLNNLVQAIIPCKSLRKFSLYRLCSEVEGFQALANLILEGNIRDLEISLNVTKYWRKMAGSIKKKFPLGSPGMFSDPMEKLGEEIFERTLKDSGETSAFDLDTHNVKASRKADNFIREIENILSEDEKLDLEEKSSIVVRNQLQEFCHIKLNSVICPLPVCNGHNGKASGFHCLFNALRDKRCKLERFYLDRCLLNKQAEYLSCLGEVILENKTLKTLKIDNILPDIDELKIQFAFPFFIGLQNNHSLTSLDLSSLRNITVDNTVFKVFCNSLSQNKTLKSLNLSSWKFELDLNETTTNSAQNFLEGTNLSDLCLEECEFNCIWVSETSSCIISEVPSLWYKLKGIKLVNTSIKTLNIGSIVIKVNEKTLTARDIVQMLEFKTLVELDVSEAPIISSPEAPIISSPQHQPVSDEMLISFFDSLRLNMANSIEILKMVNWKFKLVNMVESVGKLKPLMMSLSRLTTVSLNNVDFIHCRETNGPLEPLLLRSLIKYLPKLKHLSILRSKMSHEQVPTLVKALKYKVKKNDITLHTKHVTQEGLDELLNRLTKSKIVGFQYDNQTGVLGVFHPKAEPILKRMKSIKNIKISVFHE